MARRPPSPASHTSRAALALSEWLSCAQKATHDSTLALQPAEGGAANCTTIIHTNKMPPNGDSGVTNSGALNEVPLDNHLLAEEFGGAPPGGTDLERPANKNQVNTPEDGVTLDCGRDKVALYTGRVPVVIGDSLVDWL